MQHLSLTGLSDDGRRLLMTDGSGNGFFLDVDHRLRAALRDPRTTGPAPREKKMESTLRPRDIQTRIRAGESAESVAAAAGTTVDRIMVFAGPVIAEREHMAERAQKGAVRRRGTAEAGARTLGDAVALQLRPHGAHAEDVEWDAWRREDGRWVLTAEYVCDARAGQARFAFDIPGNYVLTENDDARWLIGDALETSPAAPARDDLQQARERRLAPVEDTEPTVPVMTTLHQEVQASAPDAPDVHTAHTPAAPTAPTSPAAAPAPAPRPTAAAAAAGDEIPLGEAPDAAARAEEPVRKPAPKNKRGRASVPSWDEIMFGGPSER
ncbi:septation protein SepH [Nocardioides jiangxiensis]|uniref:Septation protein SepH n=1 Tax=Nocardioides jiangxiensis TaxID=3064524 RepID=A0ABT9B427_9ACTN|nr:septation protein SepH [Nocardioides sp. WY-20]MDO7869468.1 septation protein SepH [Nocardioides sp. WY-20]